MPACVSLPQRVLEMERGEFTIDHISLVIKAAALSGNYDAAMQAWRWV